MSRPERRLRPVDLARLAGISTQQVRNYLDAGVLPPAPRSASGYRQFDERHRRALLTYRALARGYGWDVARSIMHAVHAGDLPSALALVDASHAGLHEERRALAEAATALETVAGQQTEPATVSRLTLRIGELAARLGVRTSALRVWEAAGLLVPEREPGTGYRRFGPAEIRDAQMISMLRRSRYLLPQIRPILDGLRRTGSTAALRAAVQRRRLELTERATAMLEGSSRLHDYLGIAQGESDEPAT
ncbi:MerR family transcriptional regulator [Plantactinospora sp. BB1]|uniref:MerR family transcriptional regulator n=1 Tax=Plantactinospora sp. BB1 TaxID=2071627 RepID=UPI000D163C73|nr:MerR family transcriptional regulator [Plantactinospora sp. BB1]AVT36959.1 MerR family transcriptional regulator [Plantactinospora sp. BB1]